MVLSKETRRLLALALKEDIGKGDITTHLMVPKETWCRAKIIFREKGVVAGLGLLSFLFKQLDRRIKVRTLTKEGKKVKRNQAVALLEGPAGAILTGERTALNFLSHLSGVATLTHRFVERIRPHPAKILATRKTTPLWRNLEKYAVRVGGGEPHRRGLDDQVLIKENHLKIRLNTRNQKPETLAEWVRRIRSRVPKGMKIEIEAENLRQACALLDTQVDMILLDNLTPKEIRKAVFLRNQKGKHPLLEASGGITLSNVRRIAKTGVERISVGRLTHSAPAIDMSLELERITA